MILFLENVFSTLIVRIFLQKINFFYIWKNQKIYEVFFWEKNVFILLKGIFNKIGGRKIWLHVISSYAISSAAISTAAILTVHTVNRLQIRPI